MSEHVFRSCENWERARSPFGLDQKHVLDEKLRIYHYYIFARVPRLVLNACTQVSSITQFPQVPYSSVLSGPELAIARLGFVWKTRSFPDFARATNDSQGRSVRF